MSQAIKAQLGSQKLHRDWPPDFAGFVNCLIADKLECNINFVSDCVYLPYLNTTQISAKSEGKCFKVLLAIFCSE